MSPAEELVFVPLGGTEEIGMNVNLFGLGPADKREWLIIDLGITFGDDTTPGIEVILPDLQFIEERRDRLHGIVLTHGHEDHLGAVPYLWSRLRVPVYATPFTASLLRKKLTLDGDGEEVEIIELPLESRLTIGPFGIELISLTHSMPEPNAVLVETPLGNIFHTGDWKFDPDPVIGEAADEAALKQIGENGVLALIGDSTNVFVPGSSGSEAALKDNLSGLIGECRGKVAVCCFASNVARLRTIYEAATANGRAVSLIGRSLWRINAAARETGYMDDLPPFLEAEDAEDIPDDEILYICTGSQGEPRAAMTRIANGDHRHLSLGAGDTVIFSSRIIPGNELAIGRIHNRLVSRGVHVLTETDHEVHVSGHPARDELARMYQLIRPQIAIPVHGEPRHILAHAALARDCQVAETIVVENGSVVKLAPGPAAIIDAVPVGRLALDQGRMLPLDSPVLRERNRLMRNGSVSITLVMDHGNRLAGDPSIILHGLVCEDELPYLSEILTEELNDLVETMDEDDRADSNRLASRAETAVRRRVRTILSKRPLTTVNIVRI